MTDNSNLSTGYQPEGAAANPSDTLDKRGERPFGNKGDSATARIDAQGRPHPDDDAIEDQPPAEGSDGLPPPQEGSPNSQ